MQETELQANGGGDVRKTEVQVPKGHKEFMRRLIELFREYDAVLQEGLLSIGNEIYHEFEVNSCRAYGQVYLSVHLEEGE